MRVDSPLIEQIRSASRTMVRELGFMQSTLAATHYSPSAVHALLEVEARGSASAAQLVQILDLEKSSVSRMVGKLVSAGELKEATGEHDGRVKRLLLTARGKRTVQQIHAYSRAQVAGALKHLDNAQQQSVVQGLTEYAGALRRSRLGVIEDAGPTHAIKINTGYHPGVVGRIAEMHAMFYSNNYGFGQFFESKVAAGAAEFVGRLDQSCNALWVATQDERIVGAIAIDGQDLGENQAHLRWFILDDGCRGGGVGQRLLNEAVAFCDRLGFSRTQLWTFKGLDAARRLYERHGFKLAKEWQGRQWGCELTEQQFTRMASVTPEQSFPS